MLDFDRQNNTIHEVQEDESAFDIDLSSALDLDNDEDISEDSLLDIIKVEKLSTNLSKTDKERLLTSKFQNLLGNKGMQIHYQSVIYDDDGNYVSVLPVDYSPADQKLINVMSKVENLIDRPIELIQKEEQAMKAGIAGLLENERLLYSKIQSALIINADRKEALRRKAEEEERLRKLAEEQKSQEPQVLVPIVEQAPYWKGCPIWQDEKDRIEEERKRLDEERQELESAKAQLQILLESHEKQLNDLELVSEEIQEPIEFEEEKIPETDIKEEQGEQNIEIEKDASEVENATWLYEEEEKINETILEEISQEKDFDIEPELIQTEKEPQETTPQLREDDLYEDVPEVEQKLDIEISTGDTSKTYSIKDIDISRYIGGDKGCL